MKNYTKLFSLIFIFLNIVVIQAQNITFSFESIDNYNGTSTVNVYANNSGADELLQGFSIYFYVNGNEVQYVSHDFSPTIGAPINWGTEGQSVNTAAPVTGLNIPS